MFLRLENKTEIVKAEKLLAEICRKNMPVKAVHHIGYPAGMRRDCKIITDGHYWFWQDLHKPANGKPPRYLNWFGLYEKERKSLGITVEVNAYEQSLNRRVAGYFAKDVETGHIYLMHSGGIGGGKKGQSKNSFLAWRDKELSWVTSSDGRTDPAIIVMPLTGKHAIEPALKYVDEVAAYKAALNDGLLADGKLAKKAARLKAYIAESTGRRKGKRSSNIDYISRHGMIVDALKTWREAKGISRKQHIANDVLIDLALMERKQICELYEVKTSSGRQSVYTALGQLFVHSGKSKCERFIVLPDEGALPRDLIETFTRLDIKRIFFRFDGKNIFFTQK